MYSFANDYSEGAHPRILEAMMNTNLEQNPGYGKDGHCERAAGLIRKECGREDIDVHFIPGGTQTNLLAIARALRPHDHSKHHKSLLTLYAGLSRPVKTAGRFPCHYVTISTMGLQPICANSRKVHEEPSDVTAAAPARPAAPRIQACPEEQTCSSCKPPRRAGRRG